MSTHTPPAAAARTSRADSRSSASAPIGAPGGRRPPHSGSSTAKLEQLSSRLDVLIRDVSFGARSPREHERHVDEAEAIAAGLRACFREPTRQDPSNPPLWHQGGKAVW